MQVPDSVEEMLTRLMPHAMSQGGQASIEEMLDELMGPEELDEVEKPEQVIASRSAESGFSAKKLIPLGLAAALGALAVVNMNGTPEQPAVALVAEMPKTVPAGMVLVGEEDRVEGMTDDGWISDPDGTTMQAVRMRVVQENTMLDKETGMVFQLTEPREELVLIPVTSF